MLNHIRRWVRRFFLSRRRIEVLLLAILTNQERLMSALEDLSADVAVMVDEAVNDLTAAIDAALKATGNDPAIVELDAKVKAATQTLKDKFAVLVPAAPGPEA